jgi:hypothetical protein
VDIGQQCGPAEEVDGPIADADPPHQAQLLTDAALGIRQERVGKPEPLRPVPMALGRVEADPGDDDPLAHELVMMFAELAKLAESSGSRVAHIEEERQRGASRELAKAHHAALGGRKREIG